MRHGETTPKREERHVPRRAALQVVQQYEEPVGDPLERQAQMHQWTPGQVECRAKHQHLYKPAGIGGLQVYGKKVAHWEDLPVGTRILIMERCTRCKSVGRKAEHVVTARGVRALEDWKPDYGSYKDVEYLLRPGSGRLDDGDIEELKGHMYLDNARLKFVAEDE